MNETFAERIKWARKRAGFTQVDAAKEVGITQSAYSELETGRSASSSYTPQLASLFGVDANWLATGKGNALQDGSEFLEKFNSLTPESQRIVVQLLDQLAQSTNS